MTSYIVDKNVRITLVNPITWENYDLYFKLYNTELAKKWVKNIENMRFGEKRIREKSVKYSQSQSYDMTKFSKNGFIEKLNLLIDSINTFYDKTIKRAEEINQDTLNYLHEEYEIYGVRLAEKLSNKWWDTAWKELEKDDPKAVRWPGITFNEDFHTNFLRLNDMIHTVEMFLNTNIGKIEGEVSKFSFANILISHDPRIDYELTEEDCASFFKYYRFGCLYLGYNTLGKNLQHILLDDDYRAAEENAVALQTTWSNEVMAALVDDLATPDRQTKMYHKFKNMGLEKHGWQFADHKNREGYLLIGTLYSKQKDDIYSYSQHMKIDLSGYTSVHSLDIVDDTQMVAGYTNPMFRLPNWKKPLPVQGKKINEIKNPEWAIITWILNDICTYSCRYCPPNLHNGRNHLFDWDLVESFLNDLFLFYSFRQKRKLLFSLSGGEPTLSPFFPEMVKKIYELDGYIGLTTNLSRSKRYIEENFQYLSYVGCSFHPAQEFPNNTVDEWIEKIKVASNLTLVTVRLMMDPLYWDECIKFIERIKNETTARLEIVYVDDQYGNVKNKITDIKYTDEQLDFFKNFKTIPSRTNPVQILETNPYFKKYENNVVIHYNDNTTEFCNSPQMYINKGQTNFFDYKCAIGTESMFIHQNGHIRRGNCDVGGIIGTIKQHKNINWNALLRKVWCNVLRCSCGADIPISKSII